jgi:hypothetical protein
MAGEVGAARPTPGASVPVGGVIGLAINMLISGKTARSPYQHYSSSNISYASAKYRSSQRESTRKQNMRTGAGRRAYGWNADAQAQGRLRAKSPYKYAATAKAMMFGFAQALEDIEWFQENSSAWYGKRNRSGNANYGGARSQGSYWLGKPSQEFYDKFAKWGEQGPRGNEGWRNTLTNAPPSKSTTAPTQMFNQEVIQTRETRVSGAQRMVGPFQTLQQHTNTPRLNPALAYMYKSQNMMLGAVRRAPPRFL